MRILCISPAFIPLADSEAFCGGKMICALREAGLGVYVLSNAEYPANGREPDGSGCWNSLSGCVEAIGQDGRRGGARAARLGWRYRCWGLYPRWIGAVVGRAIALHAEEPFDLVYSRSLPPYAHVAGCWCARTLRLPWVAGVNDPWDVRCFPDVSVGHTGLIYGWMSSYWMQRTLREADLLLYPSLRLLRFTGGLARVEQRASVLPHVGWARPSREPAHGFRLVHAGKLGTNEVTGRSSAALLRGLKRFLAGHPEAILETKLVLVGPGDGGTKAIVSELGLQNVVTSVGRVSYEESLQHIGSASVCVLIEAQMKEGIYLPSKFVDYVAAGKPVLAISPAGGTIADFGSDPGVLRVDVTDAEGISTTLARLYDLFRRGTLGELRPSDELMTRFSPRGVATGFLEALSTAGIGCD